MAGQRLGFHIGEDGCIIAIVRDSHIIVGHPPPQARAITWVREPTPGSGYDFYDVVDAASWVGVTSLVVAAEIAAEMAGL